MKTIVHRPVFGLFAKGESLNGYAFKMHSRTIFECQEDLEAYISEFKEMCCDTKHFECAVPETLKISVVKYDLCVSIESEENK